MTLFLRNEKNQTLLDLECWVKSEDENSFVEISSSIDIRNYSWLLLKEKNNKLKQIQLINDFEELDELRGWLWESYFSGKKNTEKEFDNVISILKNKLTEIGNRYDLHLVVD